jgi:hypothetical protein
LILPVPGFSGVVDYLQRAEDYVIESPEACLACGGSLWSHGTYRRRVEGFSVCILLAVPRWICKVCRKSLSLLFDFVLPGKKFSAEVSATYVEEYAMNESSYRKAAWGEHDLDRDDAESSTARAFRAVSDACGSVDEMLMAVQQACTDAAVNLIGEPFEEVQCPNSSNAKSEKKRIRLNRLSYLFGMLSRFLHVPTVAMLEKNAAISAAYRKLFLGSRLSAPHSLKQALF